jgi:hypothetical protein
MVFGAIVYFLAIFIIAAMVAGCSGVQLSPAYHQQLVMADALVNGLNADCQAGDPNACKEGLNEAAKTLRLFLDASEGRSSSAEGGGQ